MRRPVPLVVAILMVAIVCRANAQASTFSGVINGRVKPTNVEQPALVRPNGLPPSFMSNELFLAGAFALGTVAVLPFDEPWSNRLQAPRVQENAGLDATAKGVRQLGNPGAIILTSALYAGGRLLHKRRVADAGLHATEAILVSGAVTTVLKRLTGRARPHVANPDPNEHGADADAFRPGRGVGDYTSFPSGHTTTAFAAASALTLELSAAHPRLTWIVGPLLYGSATAVGLSRMYENKHWASDVIAGAAVGTLIGRRLVAHQHARPGNRLDKLLLPNVVKPSTQGIAVGWSLPLR